MRHDLSWVSSRLAGLKCWDAVNLPDSTVLQLGLGQRIPDTSRGAQRLPPEQRFIPEYSILLECPWRLDGPSGVITGWMDYADEMDGPISEGIRHILSRQIVRTTISRPACDLTVRFEGGYALKAFAATSIYREEQDAWSLFHHADGLVVTVGPMGKWSTDRHRRSNEWMGEESRG